METIKLADTKQEKIYKNLEYPFTELFRLLPQLQTTNDTKVLEAIQKHASETLYRVLMCIESIGSLVGQVSIEGDAEDDEMADTGWVIMLLGNLAKSCRYAQGEAEFRLAKRSALSLVV